MDIYDLQDYSDAWSSHDIEKIMQYMTLDCVFETGGGTHRYGTRYQGYKEVKKRFIEVFTEIPDIRFENAQHFVQGDRGCSHWTIIGTRNSKEKVEVDGCDLFTFYKNKIRVKNSFIKILR